ncbi:MAG TPA: ribonuclease HI family protein [Candidatus Cybelea sp.]
MLCRVPRGRAVYALPPPKGGGVEATLYADGGSRGNPGPAASAAVLIAPGGELLEEVGAYLGVATNNVAEWTALLLGLEAASKRGIRRLRVRLDSELVVKQLRGEYRVKHAALQPLHRQAMRLLRAFESVDVGHVRREQNVMADRLVNRVLDQEANAPVK